MRQSDEEDDFAVSDDEYPLLCDKKVELESASDSSDWNHDGNGIPCRFYNHDGCIRGTECRFSHAPDHKSVRDRLCVIFFYFPVCVKKSLTDFGRWPAGATFVCIFCSVTANLAVARVYTLTTRPTCHPAGGGKTRRNGSFSAPFRSPCVVDKIQPLCHTC